jgi:hypothetical protein
MVPSKPEHWEIFAADNEHGPYQFLAIRYSHEAASRCADEFANRWRWGTVIHRQIGDPSEVMIRPNFGILMSMPGAWAAFEIWRFAMVRRIQRDIQEGRFKPDQEDREWWPG